MQMNYLLGLFMQYQGQSLWMFSGKNIYNFFITKLDVFMNITVTAFKRGSLMLSSVS